MVVDLNPILLYYKSNEEDLSEEKFYKWRQIFEDPANKLNIGRDLRIDKNDTNKDHIFKIKENICQALLDEEVAINSEIQELRNHKVTVQDIEKGDMMIEGISYTSILVYMNENTPETQSHRNHPG